MRRIVLVAVLVTFGVLTKHNEVTAFKASGVSLYRLTMPVLFVSANLPQFEGEFKRRKITSVLTKPFDLNDLLERVRTLCPQ